MVQYVFTPWRDRRELLAVRRQFYPEHHRHHRRRHNHHQQQHAPQRSSNPMGNRPGLVGGGDLSPPPPPPSSSSTSSSSSPPSPYLFDNAGGAEEGRRLRRGGGRKGWERVNELGEPGERGERMDDDDDGGGGGGGGGGAERESRDERAEKQRAVARVSMWMHRGGCPHMVESTALLTAAMLSDDGGGVGLGMRSRSEFGAGMGSHRGSGGRCRRESAGDGVARAAGGYAVRASYSAAFSRFVTGLLDSHQDKQRKMSMYDVAKSVGLPATFVELRHQATHEQLPSLTRLRAAARAALAWIWEYYWRRLPDADLHDPGSGTGEGVTGPSGGGGGGGGGEGGTAADPALRELIVKYLEGGDEEGLKEDLGRFDEALVLTTLHSIAAATRDTKVLRRAVALTREILERRGDPDRMEEDGRPREPGGGLKDLERIRAELGRAWGELMQAEEMMAAAGGPEQQGFVDAGTAEDRPAWVLYEEEAWVPKPIGVV